MASMLPAADPAEAEVLAAHERRASLKACFDAYTVTRFPRATSVAEWEERKQLLRREVLDCLGLWPLPDRVPLEIQVAAEHTGEGYVLQRLSWQVFDSVRATGWLYLPKGVRERAPAVICPHGHWDVGARHRTVQARCLGLAKLGYVVLAVDSVHLDDYRTGVNPVGLMTWNNMRGVDVLCSRPDVDPERIGCTGASGGGQQTMYLMAVEPRLAAAAPTVMISCFSRILDLDTAHCYCNHVPAIARYTDEPEMCAVFAPKPALYMCDTQDWTQWFPHEGFPEIQAIYDLYGARERVECHQWDVGHDYTRAMRETMYAFFEQWLKGEGPAEGLVEPEMRTMAPEELLAKGPSSPTGVDLPHISAEFRARRAAPPTDWRRESTAEVAARVRPALADLMGEPVAGAMPLALKVRGATTLGAVEWLKVTFESEPGVMVPGLIAKAASGVTSHGAVLAAPGGKQEAIRQWRDSIEGLTAAGWVVLCPDYRCTGELAAKTPVWLLHGILWGRPLVAMTARDLRAAVHALAALPDVQVGSVALVALGPTAVPGLLAAALDGGQTLEAFACDNLGPTYATDSPPFPLGDTFELLQRRSRPEELVDLAPPVLPNILGVGDLPEIAACMTPRPMLLAGVGDPAPYAAIISAGARVDAQPAATADILAWLQSL